MEHDDLMARDERFARWYREHHDRIRNLCRGIVRDAHAAEDLAQETLLRAWVGRDRMRDDDIGAWLSVVARNLSVSYIRRSNKVEPTSMVPDVADEAADPLSAAERSETRRAVLRALHIVGDRQRRLLLRREVEGLEYAALGADVGLSAGGTRATLFRARRMLRDHLAAAGEGAGAYLLGLRVRSRSLVRSISERAEAMSASLLQVTVALMATGGLVASGSVPAGPALVSALSAPAAASVATIHRSSARTPATPAFGTRAPTPINAGSRTQDRTPGLGLEPNGEMHPSAPAPNGRRIPLGDITWGHQGEADPYPWDGSYTQRTESALARFACEKAARACA